MTERKRETPWFSYLLMIGFLYLLASCFEPLKTINEMYPFPNTFSAHVLAGFVLIISGTVWFTLASRKGRAIRKEIIAKRKDVFRAEKKRANQQGSLEVKVMRSSRKWWEKKWYWVACFLFGFLGFLLVLVVGSFLFPEAPLFRSLFSIIVVSFGILLGAYLTSRVWKRRFEIRILRMAYVAGGVFLGIFAWSFIVIPLALVYDFPGEGAIVILLLFVLVAIGAVIMDAFGKRRDYRPFMEGGGNI